MSTVITFNGSSYTIPADRDTNWSTNVSNYLIAIATGSLQKTGGSFTLTAELDFGNSFGLKSSYIKSRATNPASTGIFRLGNAESVSWRNQANNADLALTVTSSNVLQFNSQSVLYSGISSIVDADISASAAIALSKLAAVTSSRALVSDGSGFVSASSVTSTELGYVSGVTSSIQTQINGKEASITSGTTAQYWRGDKSFQTLDKSAVGLSNVDNTSDATKNAASVTLTNKTLTSPSLTTPSLDVMTLDGQASTPSSPSSGFYKAYVKDSTGKLTILNSAGTETAVGGGSSGINLIGDGSDAEAGTTGWSTFADAASSRPVDGTGGSANVTWTTSSSTPLYGANSFVFTKDAVNRQGEGVSYAFTVSPAHQAKVLQISFDYIVGSGTFVAGSSGVDSDIIAYIYDVTNSTLIEPSSFKLLSNSTTIADRFNATFQTSATGTSYRLLLFCATTSASAFTLKLDNISVSPSNYVYGAPIKDWVSFTPTVSHTTNAVTTGFRKQNGDSEEYMVRTAYSGATDNTGYTITIANGKSIDTSKLLGTQGGLSPFGIAAGHDSGGTHGGIVVYASTTTVQIIGDDGSGGWNGAGGTPFTPGSGDYIETRFSVPILGWSSSVQMSDSADTRVLQAKLGGSTTSITGSATLVQFDAAQYDSHGLLTTGASSRFTASMPGFYNVNAFIQFNPAAIGSGGIQTLLLYKNGSSFDILDRQNWSSVTVQVALSGSTKVYLVAGDYIDLRATNNTTTSIDGNAYMTVERATGPSAIAASESINARYTTNAAQPISTATNTIIDFEDVSHDSHGAVTTGTSWNFTAPISGVYNAKATVTSTATGNFTGTEYFELKLYKNGNFYSSKYVSNFTGSSVQIGATHDDDIKLLAGDYIDFRVYQTSGASLPLETTAGYNFVSIKRTGN